MTFFNSLCISLYGWFSMLRRCSLRKITLGVFCLIILLILYIFPKHNENKNYLLNTDITITNVKDIVYLIDSNGYVSRINASFSKNDSVEKALEMIEYMTLGGMYESLIPNGFKAIIPAGTKVLDYNLSDGNFKINFSSDLLKINPDDEMKLIEALIYSLTSINNIDSLTILVDGIILNKLPSSQEFLPNPLDRSFGINKKYDISSIKGTTKTTLYYLSKNNDLYYYVPITKISNDVNEKIEIIIKELSSSPIYETSLMSYLNSEATLQNYEFLDKKLNIDFNNAILSDITKNDILEEVTYAINLSIKDNYDIDSVTYTVDNNKIVNFDLKDLE